MAHPSDAVRGTKNPPPESQQHVTPEQLSRGAIVQFETSGALHHGKVKTWGKQGARVVTRDGEFDVGYEDIKGLGVHPDVAAEQPEVMAVGAAKQAGPATPQEDRPVQPTKYTLDDFAVGQHVTGHAVPTKGSPLTTYVGTVAAIQEKGPMLSCCTPTKSRPLMKPMCMQRGQRNLALPLLMQTTASKSVTKLQASPRARSGST